MAEILVDDWLAVLLSTQESGGDDPRFTTVELMARMGVSDKVARGRIKAWIADSRVEYAGQKMVKDMTGSMRPTHSYRVVRK